VALLGTFSAKWESKRNPQTAHCIDPPSWPVTAPEQSLNDFQLQEHTGTQPIYVQDVADGWNKNMATTHQNTK